MQMNKMKNILETLKNYKDLPNQLSLFRIAVVPVILILYPFEYEALRLFCSFLFWLACMSDWLDGFLARRYKLESKVGAILDPIADRLLTGAALILLVQAQYLWAWMAGLLLSREIAVSGLRLVALQNGFNLPVEKMGKLKTMFQFFAFFCLLVKQPLFGWPFEEVGMISIWIAFFLSYYSFYQYTRSFLQKFRELS